jgi:putative salt-induced outer membrane protein YdiY
VNVAYLTSEADDVTLARSLTVTARHGIRTSDRSELFGRLGYARDRFAGIENRTTAEFGAAYTPRRPRRHAFGADLGLGFTRERRLDAADFQFLSATSALAYIWTIAPRTELKNEVAFVADLQEARNWRATNALAMSVGLTRKFSLKMSQNIERRNVPVPGFKRTDMRLSAALVVTLQRF